MSPQLAMMQAFEIEPGHVVAYVALTGAFLFLVWLFNDSKRPLGISLILLGVLVTILSVGYGLISTPTVMVLTPSLMKIGFLLVLGGVAWSLLNSCRTPATKEADHV